MRNRERWMKRSFRGLGMATLGLLSGCGAGQAPETDVDDPPPPDGALQGCGDVPTSAARPTPAGPDAYTLTGVAGDSAALEGTCGGAGWESVLEFVAPAAGYWTFGFDAAHTAFAGVVHLRTACDAPDTELACSIDTSRGWQLGVASADLAAGQHVFVVVDAATGRGGDYTLGVFRADAPIPPSVTNARAFRFADGHTTLNVSGTDPNGDVKWVRYTMLDAAGRPYDARGFGETTDDAESLRPTVGTTAPVGVLADLPAGAAAVRVALVDATGAASEAVDVPILAQPGVPEGTACDVFGATSRCAGDRVCLGDEAQAICVAPTAPRVVDAHAYRRDDGALTFALSGTDETRDATRFVAALLPAADDTPLVLDAEGNTEGEVFTQTLTGLADFSSGGQMDVAYAPADLADFPRAARVRLTLLDAQGGRSAPFVVPIEAMPIAGADAACDPWQYENRCEASTFCLSLYGASEGVCADVLPPALDEAAVALQPDGRMHITATGHRTEYTPLAVDVYLLSDDSETPVDLPDLHALVFFPEVDAATGDFTLDAPLVAGPDWDPLPIAAGDFVEATRLKFVARDVQNLESEPVIVALPRRF